MQRIPVIPSQQNAKEMHPIWGIDLGGTKIEGVVLESADSPRELCRLRVDTEAQLGYDHIINQIAKLILRHSG